MNVINSLSQTRYINHCKAFQRGSYILEYIGVHSKRAVCSSTKKESFLRERVSEVTFSYSYTSHDFSVTKKYSLARKKHCKGNFTFCFNFLLCPSSFQAVLNLKHKNNYVDTYQKT